MGEDELSDLDSVYIDGWGPVISTIDLNGCKVEQSHGMIGRISDSIIATLYASNYGDFCVAVEPSHNPELPKSFMLMVQGTDPERLVEEIVNRLLQAALFFKGEGDSPAHSITTYGEGFKNFFNSRTSGVIRYGYQFGSPNPTGFSYMNPTRTALLRQKNFEGNESERL